jgi:hypothetical protein
VVFEAPDDCVSPFLAVAARAKHLGIFSAAFVDRAPYLVDTPTVVAIETMVLLGEGEGVASCAQDPVPSLTHSGNYMSDA